MINEVKQHGNKIVDEVKNLWGYHVFKILIVSFFNLPFFIFLVFLIYKLNNLLMV